MGDHCRVVRVTERISQLLHFFTFFRTLVSHTKSLDSTRPVTFITDSNYARDKGVRLSAVCTICWFPGPH